MCVCVCVSVCVIMYTHINQYYYLSSLHSLQYNVPIIHANKKYILCFGMVWFYYISTIVDYLMPKPVFTYILDI